jgi:hypothetical protein
MSIEERVAQIVNQYNAISIGELQKEMKLYNKRQIQEIRKNYYRKVFSWGDLDEFDRSSLKSVLYKFTAWTFVVMGFQKIMGDKTNSEIVGWRQEWNKNAFMRVMLNRRGIPVFLMGVTAITPDLFFHLSRIGMKYFHIDQTVKDAENEKRFLAGEFSNQNKN